MARFINDLGCKCFNKYLLLPPNYMSNLYNWVHTGKIIMNKSRENARNKARKSTCKNSARSNARNNAKNSDSSK